MDEMPLNITIGDKYRPAMAIDDQAEADAYFEQCVLHNLRCRANKGRPADRQLAEATERSNLCYFAGYFDNETRRRVESLFHGQHPIFGSIAAKGPPTDEEAFQAGFDMGSH